MKSKFDLDSILDQTLFGLDILSMLGDVEHFIEFSESNIEWQKQRQLKRTQQECDEGDFDDPNIEVQYRHQMLDSVEYRFEVSLKQRVRYAGLTSLITTIEWCLLALKKRAAFDFPKKSDKTNEAVHILSVFNERAGLNLTGKIQFLEHLVEVSNCIVHAAGLPGSFRREAQLRTNLPMLRGITFSSANFLGESIAVESGFLESVIEDVRGWLPSLEKAAAQQGLLRK